MPLAFPDGRRILGDAEDLSFSHAGVSMTIVIRFRRAAARRPRFLLSAVGLLILSIASTTAVGQQTVKPANAVEAVLMEHALTAEELEALKGKTVNLLFTDGKREEAVTLTDFVTARIPHMPRMIVVTRSGETRERRFPTTQLFQVEVGDRIYRVNTIPSAKAAVLQDTARHDAQVREQLQGRGEVLWEKLDDAAQQGFTGEEIAFLQKVKDHFRTLPMRLQETRYFLFLTDMPPAQAAPYLRQLDKMNEMLGSAFGFAPGENVWRGKAVVVAFVAREAFVEFQQTFLDHTPDVGTQGLCNSFSDGRVVISCYRGDDPVYFGGLLVHETSHGYVHRFLSTVDVPSWLDEGISEWIARGVVPECPSFRLRQQEAAARLQQTGSLDGFFVARQIEPWHYGVAISVVDLLVKENPSQFRLLFNGIKEGLPWQDSLMRAYGLTPEALATLYGRAIGVPGLRP